jgi:hypothetical protein
VRRRPADRSSLSGSPRAIRVAKRSALVAAIAWSLACRRGGPEAASAAAESPAALATARAPDGVVIDPPPVLPAPLARSNAQGIVSLREPPAHDAVVELVRAFLDGWQRESLETLLGLSTPDAGLIDGPDRGHAALIESWRQRLRAHDYGRLAGAELVLPERIERWEWDELGTANRPARPSSMKPGEILVRAPLEVTRVAGERVFGDVVMLVLKRQDGGLRIAGYGEVDAQ